jgi:hypothetical protein
MTRILASATLLLLACGDDATSLTDAGRSGGDSGNTRVDSGSSDGGALADGASPDAGSSSDAGSRPDAPAGSNTTCATALDVGPSEASAVQDLAGGSSEPRVCDPPGTGPMLWYRTVVPAGARVSLNAMLLTAVDPIYPYTAVRQVSDCAALTCEAITGSFPNPTIVELDNSDGASPRAFLYAVTIEDAVSGSREGGTFELIVSDAM